MTVKITRRTAMAGMAGSLVVGPPRIRAGPDPAEIAGDHQHRRRRRQSGAHPAGDRELSRRQAQSRLQGHLQQGAGARAARQDQGPAGCRPRRHRRRADRHRHALGRRRAEALDAAAARLRGQPAEARRHLSARRHEDAGALPQNQGVCIVFCPAGPLLEYIPDRVKNVPTTAEELLAWAKQNPNRFLYARPANSGPGRIFMMGLALHPQGQGSDGSDQRLGQDLGLSQGARPVHRVLSGRHRRRP